MGVNVQAVRGMNDIVPEQISVWQHVEKILQQVVTNYGYQEIRFPIVEKTALFTRTIGEVTDIVEKEMYTFEDRNGDSLTLRPEGTAGCVRAGIEQGLLYNQIQRLWYMGPMFRHERPQKGRYRQFHQLGVEAFGLAGPDVDAEHILMMARLWEKLGVQDQITLQLNSLGSKESRQQYREALVKYFSQHLDALDNDSQRRLHTNPLRILDSKNPEMQELILAAPKLPDYLDDAAKTHFAGLTKILDAAGIKYEVNPRLVRGLDYYCLTVFEWVTNQLGAQGTVCAGGRYDGLVEQLGGKPTPAAGFAIGLERLVELVASQKEFKYTPDAYLVLAGEKAENAGFLLAKQLRDAVPDICLVVHCGGGNFKSQFKKADKSGAQLALILGDMEVEQNTVAVKYLREDKPQQEMTVAEVVKVLKQLKLG